MPVSSAPLTVPAEVHRHGQVGSRYLPPVSILEPGVWPLPLPPPGELLPEDTEVVAQPVPERRVVQGSERFQETGGQAAEAAIAQARVGLLVHDAFQIQAQLGHHFGRYLAQTGRDQVVLQQPTQQVLQRKVVDGLGLVLLVCPLGRDCTVDERLADRELKRRELVGGRGLADLEPPDVPQVVDEAVAERLPGNGVFCQARCQEHPPWVLDAPSGDLRGQTGEL